MLSEMFAKYDLVTLQNHPANVNQDRLSFCGFFSSEEEYSQLARNMRDRIARYSESS